MKSNVLEQLHNNIKTSSFLRKTVRIVFKIGIFRAVKRVCKEKYSLSKKVIYKISH